jgi:hypothetical protein
VQHLGFHPDGFLGIVELEVREESIEDVRSQRNRVVGVFVAMDDVPDVVQRRRQCDDHRLVGLLEALVGGSVERDVAALQQIIKVQRAVSDDLDVLRSVVVVPLPRDGVDVLRLEVGLDLGIRENRGENRVQSPVGEVVLRVGIVLVPGARGGFSHTPR